jgi:hypothetical protein
MFCYGISSEKVTLKRQKSVFSMEKGFESDALQAKNARFSMLKGEKQGFSMEKGIESDARQAKNARFSMPNGEKQGFSMEKRVKLPVDHIDLQAEGPQCPFGLLFATCYRAEGMSQGSAARTRRTGGALYFPGALWHTRPQGGK